MNDKNLTRQLMAEFLGTFVLMVFGLAVNAQVSLSNRTAGDFFSINTGWGLAVTFGVYCAGGVSGAHLNPAVTVALAVWRRFSWRMVVPFIVVQMLAAFAASMLIYYTYVDAVNAVELKAAVASESETQVADAGAKVPRTKETRGVWATYPADHLEPIRGGLVDQIVGTGMLLLCIFALTDQKNQAPEPGIAPLLIGAVVFAIGMTFGFNCGYAINPGSEMNNLVTAFTSDYHTATLVPVFAYGPGAELFAGIYDNTAIFHKMKTAFGFIKKMEQ